MLSQKQCIKLTGNYLPAGILLFRIQYWCSRTTLIGFDGPWTVKSKNEWLEDTGLTRHQYDRALARLVSLGVVKVKHKPHPFKPNCLRVTFLQFVPPVKTDDQSSHIADNQSSALPDDQSSAKADDIIYSSYEVGNEVGNEGGESQLITPKKEGGQEMGKVEKFSTVFEAVSGFKKKEVPKEVKNLTDFELLWKVCVSKAFPEWFQPAWTKNQKAFAKQIMEKIPKGTLKECLEYVLLNWMDFRFWMVEYSSKKDVPLVPDLLFVLKFTDFVINYYRMRSAPPIEESGAGSSAQGVLSTGWQ
jgi:hypothetical protein